MSDQNERRVEVAVMGLGAIAQTVHLRNLQLLDADFRVRHLCDVSRSVADRFAENWPDTRPLVSDTTAAVCDDTEVEAVLVLTGGPHGAVVRDLIEAGKHVFCEKPLGLALDEVRELESLAAQHERVLQVGYMKMHDPAVGAARRLMPRLGHVRLLRITVLHPTDEAQVDLRRIVRGPVTNHRALREQQSYEIARLVDALGEIDDGFTRYYADVLMGSIVHQAALVRGLGFTLPASPSYARIDPSRPVTGSAPPDLTLMASLPDGPTFNMSWVWTPDLPEYVEVVEVIGTAGTARILVAPPYEFGRSSRLEVVRPTAYGVSEQTITTVRATGFIEELRMFASTVRNGGGLPPRYGPAGVLEDTRFLQGVLASTCQMAGTLVGGEAARR